MTPTLTPTLAPTQALALAMWLLFLRNETMLGGTNGLTDFKSLLGFELTQPATKRGLYITTCAALLGTYYLCRYMVHSKVGKLLVAIRDGEHRLRFIGYQITRYKISICIFLPIILITKNT